MAEVERARSTRFRVIPPVDLDASDRAWGRAEALDGGRVPGVGESVATTHPADASVALTLEPSGGTTWLDGKAVAGAVIATRAGPHAVVVTWDDVPVWAGSIETPAGSSNLHLVVPGPPPCSVGDVAHARATSDGVQATEVRCGSWVAVAPGGKPGSVAVAACETSRCGARVEWSSPAGWMWTPPREAHHAGWPTWATWGLVGTGAVVVTGVVLVASGAFKSAPHESRFVSGGLKTQSE